MPTRRKKALSSVHIEISACALGRRHVLLHGCHRRPSRRHSCPSDRAFASRVSPGATKPSFQNDCDLYSSGSPARDLVIAGWRWRLPDTMERHQERLLTADAAGFGPIGKQNREARKGNLAAPLLGTRYSRRCRSGAAYRLYPLQSGETRPRAARIRLAAQQLPSLRCARRPATTLGWRCQGIRRLVWGVICAMAVVLRVGIAARCPPYGPD